MEGGSLDISHDDEAAAETLANELAMLYWQQRHNLEPPLFMFGEVIRPDLIGVQQNLLWRRSL